MHRAVHKALSLPIAVHSSVKKRMGIKAKLLLLVALMVGSVSVVAQTTTNQPTTTAIWTPPTATSQEGWMRLAHLNMTEPGASCPTSLRQINTPAKLCGRHTAPGCSGVTYPVDGIRYSKVCGQARGYQYYSSDAFHHSTNDINSHYVDGVSITYGDPRHHLWTYACGLSDDYNIYNNCPCAKYPGDAPPAFVGLDYYCESGITGRHVDNNRIALEDPLWDGDGCGPGNNCCNQTGMPWFCRTLPREVSEDIEVRLCFDQVNSNE